MRCMQSTSLAVALAATAAVAPAWGQMATPHEAWEVAQNWVSFMTHEHGHWGGYEQAYVADVQELRRADRVVGFFCPVEPRGYVVVSLRKELAAVKAYSDTSDLDPESEEGPADWIKGGLERVIIAIEQQLGPIETVPPDDLDQLLEVNYRAAWGDFGGDVDEFLLLLENGGMRINYQASDIMLTSTWDQDPPYNDDCPAMGCGSSNGRAKVGCVATAGAQLMRYWCWPPYGNGGVWSDLYDWPNMPDEAATGSPPAIVDAVAEFCHEVGLAVNMDYGCTTSWASTWEMEGAYENQFRYAAACARIDRVDFSASVWYELFRAQMNLNRPIHYRVENHSIVGDGWQEAGPLKQYHMNYGWDNSYTQWYTLDALYLGGVVEEYMLVGIYPDVALGDSLMPGHYTRNALFPYRYFDRDTTGLNTIFDVGQLLQFLPNVTVGAEPGGYVHFQGGPALDTVFFTRGDESRGIRIDHGDIKIYHGGALVLR